MTLHMYFLIFSFLCVFVFLSREVKYRYSKQIPPKNISTNKCPPKVYLPTLMTMICVREGSTGHIPCVHYSQVGPIPLRPLLFSNYYHQDPSPLPPNYHHYHHEDHNHHHHHEHHHHHHIIIIIQYLFPLLSPNLCKVATFPSNFCPLAASKSNWIEKYHHSECLACAAFDLNKFANLCTLHNIGGFNFYHLEHFFLVIWGYSE